MTHGSLFSGIGGFDFAAEWAGIENKWQCEIDDFCQKVLTKNFPNVKKYRNIFELKQPEPVDIISGGFPCQPFSVAGKRKGTSDNRYLWPEMLRIISEVKPSFIIGENVAGLLTLENGKTFEGICASLEDEGYTVEPFIIPACSVGAWHRRDRIWIIGTNRLSQSVPCNSKYTGRSIPQEVSQKRSNGSELIANTKRIYVEGFENRQGEIKSWGSDWWETEPDVGRVADGIPQRVDRLKGLGNAIMPQIAYILFQTILNALTTTKPN